MKDPGRTHDVNVAGTYNVFLAARAAGAQRIVFSSSSSVYGDDATLPKREDRIGRPLSPYAASKRANEIDAEGFAAVFAGTIVGLRYFNVFGPRQRHDSPYAAVIPLFFRAALQGESPVIYGDGLQSRDFTFVEDVARANLLAAGADLPSGRAHLYNVGAGGSTSVLDLWREIASLTRARQPANHAPPRAGDVRDSRASIEKAKREIGYEPEYDLPRGLSRTLPWYRGSLAGQAAGS
jgi:nucleoside-diphosphate-sugar epimerase